MTIKLIIFDLYGTLIYNEGHGSHDKFGGMQRMYNAIAPKISFENFRNNYDKIISTKRWNDRSLAYKEFLKVIDVEPSDENVENMISAKNNVNGNEIQEFDFAVPLLKKLKENGYKIAIGSNTSNFSMDKLRGKLELFKYVDYPCFSFDMGLIKPDLAFFWCILGKAGVEPEEAIMIGDTYEQDILPAEMIGIKAIHFKGDSEDIKEELKKLGVKVE